ncbi:MAG: sporulation protein [Turicibacter sp.]|nr:sporulation protein [Turicibacter sp.]
MKPYLTMIPLLAGLILLVIFPEPVIMATRTGVLAWADKVVPALFPFLALTGLLTAYQLPQMLGKALMPLFKHLLKISPVSFFIILMSFMSGNPSGARIAKEYFDEGAISQREFRGLLYFCNFASPLFIIGTTGVVLYDSPRVGYLLLFAHLAGSLAVFLCCYPMLKNTQHAPVQTIRFPTLAFSELLLKAIETATSTLVRIGGVIVFFYIVTAVLETIRLYHLAGIIFAPLLGLLQLENASPLMSGLVEFTQGVFKMSSNGGPLHLRLAITAFLISFAGLSVHTQVLMFSKGSGFKYLQYVLFRTLHGWASALVVLFGWHFFLTDMADVFMPMEPQITAYALTAIPFSIGIIGFYFLLAIFLRGKAMLTKHAQ